MATILRSACRKKITNRSIALKVFKRLLLSDAYKCEDAWLKRLKSPVLTQVSFSPLAVQIFEKLENSGRSSLIDMDILANKMHDMKPTEVEFTELLLKRFHHTPDGLPVRDSIVHAVARAYIQLGLPGRVLDMIRQRLSYGLLPDNYTTHILMDEFIKKEKYEEAALLASEMMLQEDFSDPVTYLLSLYSCVKFYKQSLTDVESLQAEDSAQPENVEEEKVVVKFFQRPYYDDHFDIKNEKFLHGKTLYFIGKNSDDVLGRSLQLIGLGLYEKFYKAMDLLQKWTTHIHDQVVLNEAIEDFKKQLENAPTKDPNVEIKEQAIRTVDDEISQLRITPDEKDKCMKDLEVIIEKLQSSQRLSTDSLELVAETLVKQEIGKHEPENIEKQTKNFDQWNIEREEMLELQIREYKRKQKEEEIQTRFMELQEKEELLSVFEKQDQLNIALRRFEKSAKKQKEEKQLTELEKEEEEERKLKIQQKRKL